MPPKAKARMDQIIKYMEVTKDWKNTRYIEPLKGYGRIYEIKFIVNNIQYRPLGCYGPGERSFTLLTGAMEKGDRFSPKNAPWIAVKRRQMVIKDERRYTRGYD